MDHQKNTNLLTSWKLWCVIAAILGVILLANISSFKGILPYLLILVCPLSMLFMMRDHHK